MGGGNSHEKKCSRIWSQQKWDKKKGVIFQLTKFANMFFFAGEGS